MADTFLKTIQLLSISKNRAATRLLGVALRSSHEGIRRQACLEMLTSRGNRNLVEMIRGFDTLDETVLKLLAEHGDKLVGPLRTAITSDDDVLRRNGYRMILSLNVLETIPELLLLLYERRRIVMEDSPIPELIQSLLPHLLDSLENRKRRSYLTTTVIGDIIRVMIHLMKEYRRTDPPLILQLMLELYPYFHEKCEPLVDILRDPAHPAYLTISKMLQQENGDSIYRFLYYCLDNPEPPQLAVIAVGKRCDFGFLQYLFRRTNEGLSPELRQNLGMMNVPEWLHDLRMILDLLEESFQPGLVNVLFALKLSQEQKTTILTQVFRYAKPAGRRRVLELSSQVRGEAFDTLVVQAIEDGDPEVQATALSQLRSRDIPNDTFYILKCADSPHESVRNMVRHLLPEFRFARFWESFDHFNDDQRRSTVQLIRRIDTQFVPQLLQHLQSENGADRRKAVFCIGQCGLVVPAEEVLAGMLLHDPSPELRTQAATLLAAGHREMSRNALVQSFHRDSHPEVRAAAKASLEKRPAPWQLGERANS